MTGSPTMMRAWVVGGRGGELGRVIQVERRCPVRRPTRCCLDDLATGALTGAGVLLGSTISRGAATA